MSDPQRILDDPEAPAGLRDLLASARDDGLAPTEVARVREGLEQQIGPDGFTQGGTGLGTKLLGALAIGGVVVAAIVLANPVEVVTTPPPVEEEPATQPAPAVQPEPAPEPPVQPVAAQPEPSPEPQVTPTEPAKPTPAKADPKPQEEFELLLKARRALTKTPADALRLTKQHRRKFPKSALGEEREVIAIQALAKMGRAADARRRGEKFLAKHKGSSHRPAVENALASLEEDGD